MNKLLDFLDSALDVVLYSSAPIKFRAKLWFYFCVSVPVVTTLLVWVLLLKLILL